MLLQYPTWFILICVLVGLVYALALYFRDKSFGEQSKKLNWLLGSFRFLTVTIICLLLLTPVIRSTTTESEPPIVILAQDNSESIKANMSEEEQAAYQQKMEALQNTLSEKYALKTYSFGSKVSEGIDFSFKDKSTNISQFMEEMYDLYSNQNVGTLILASDGIYNQGSNPIYAGSKLNTPIFSVALGDTIPKKDLILKKVYNNKIAYLGDRFNAQIDVAAINCNSGSTKLSISQRGRKVFEKVISVNNDDFFMTEEVTLNATTSGIQKYTVTLSSINGEVTKVNNTKDFYIDILDARQKILLLAESPHPDIAAFRRTILNNQNYEVEIAYADKLTESVAGYDFVVLHQLPSNRNNISTVLTTIRNKRIPHMFVVGSLTSLPAFNQSQGILKINGKGTQTNDTEGVLKPGFNLFTLDASIGDNIYKFPPLSTPFGDFSAKVDANVMLTQKIGSINTEYPLLVLGEEQNIKKAVMAGEGMWKWRIFDYLQNQNHEIFDELLGKIIQYLSVKEDKRRFRAFASNNLYNENEAIIIDAELYNSNYERVNDPEATLEITNEKGDKFPFTFNKTNGSYNINAGYFPTGDYKFEARASFNNEQLKAGGEFSVKSIQLEIFETTANHQLLHMISGKNGGQVIFSDQLDQLASMIDAKGFAKPILFDTVKTRSLIHYKWIFFLLLALLTLEWFLRRYNGSY
ncbi:MAG: hypothetical protein GY810_29620 [Aureispira sp.]|nr:hypothetical protein [Aureispira sp.]